MVAKPYRSRSAIDFFILLPIILCIAAGAELYAAEAELTPLLNFRWRQEALNTLSNDASLDPTYSFGNLRLRFGLNVDWERVSIHALGQAAGAYSLPDNGSFGIGRIYFVSSGGEDTSPGQIAMAELSLQFRPSDKVSLTGGRLGVRDGLEVLSGDARFDWVKRTRMGERLIGTWDWVNVGRRFDGATVAINEEAWHLYGFGTRILQGGVDYQNAFDHLDGVDTFGAVFTSKRGRWIDSSEIRVFDILYKDSRPSTQALLGDRLTVNAIGASLIGVYPTDSGAWDLMLWGAFEHGDYGAQSQKATAIIAEGGYGWPEVKGSPWVRGGVARSSGDGDPGDSEHGTFFNMAPTNHKWYGGQDFSAFQNLTNLYGQFQVKPHPKWSLLLDAHVFRLTDTADAWYGGSGPANNQAFGYAARRPADGSQLPADIGTEIDLTANWNVRPKLGVLLTLSYFGGGDAVKRLFAVRDSSTWFSVQVAWSY